VVTRNVSELGVYVECQPGVTIPMYRLVQFQLERDVRTGDGKLPAVLRQGRVLSAVYRIKPANGANGRLGLALRLMVDPRRHAQEPVVERRATA
jgi:hypothetical protein